MSELFPGFIAQRIRHVRRGDPLRVGRQRAAAPAAARISADARDVAQGGARPRGFFTVVCADLRGYGDSGKPPSDANHAPYSKRAMALDMVEVMRSLGFERSGRGPRPRGARHASACASTIRRPCRGLALLDISPTRLMYGQTDFDFAKLYYHWFFLIQPFDMPERMIGADPAYYLRRKTGAGARATRSSTPARSRNTSAATASRRRSTRLARTIARRRPSTSRTTTSTSPRAAKLRARCWSCGARKASCTGASIRSTIGAAWRRRARAHHADGPLHRRGGAGGNAAGVRSVLRLGRVPGSLAGLL